MFWCKKCSRQDAKTQRLFTNAQFNYKKGETWKSFADFGLSAIDCLEQLLFNKPHFCINIITTSKLALHCRFPVDLVCGLF